MFDLTNPVSLYWLTVMQKLVEISSPIGCLLLVGSLLGLGWGFFGSDVWETEAHKKIRLSSWKVFTPAFIVSIPLVFLYVFIPSWDQLALIYGVPAVINNKEAQKLPNNVLKVINQKLEKELNTPN